jgi:hypothetical protein
MLVTLLQPLLPSYWQQKRLIKPLNAESSTRTKPLVAKAESQKLQTQPLKAKNKLG